MVASQRGVIAGERGYGSPIYIDHVDRIGFSSMFVLPNHQIHAHPFIPRSFLGATADMDEYSESYCENGTSQISYEVCVNNNSGDFIIPHTSGQVHPAYSSRTASS